MFIVIYAVIGVIVISLLIVIIKNIAAPKKVDSVKKLLKQGKKQAAMKLAKQLITKDPKDYKAHYYLGKAYIADNRGELALMEYKFVNENALFDATFSEVQFRKEFSALLMKYDHKEEALREILLLTKEDPTNSENFFNAGKLAEEQGRKDVALGFYKKCIQLDSKNSKAHAAIGYILFQSKQIQEAKQELDYAIRLNPAEYSCYFYLGKLYKETKDIPNAIKAFEKSQRDNEFKQKSLVERATCYMVANRLDNAQIDLQRAIELDKDDSKNDTLYARYFLAACYEKTRKLEKAIEQWEAIYAKNHSFRDVGTKLTEYKALQANDNLKDYLTCSDNEFIEMCKNIVLKNFGLTAQTADPVKNGCILIAVDSKDADWRSVRKQTQYMRFYRTPEPIEDSIIRETLDCAKEGNCSKAFIISSTGFTRSAASYAESRPIELYDKDKLDALLTNLNSNQKSK